MPDDKRRSVGGEPRVLDISVEEFTAGGVAVYDTSVLAVQDAAEHVSARALLIGMRGEDHEDLGRLLRDHAAGTVGPFDYTVVWAVYEAGGSGPGFARIDLEINASDRTVTCRLLMDLDGYGPDLWAAALTGTVALLTAAEIDAMAAARTLGPGRRGPTITDLSAPKVLRPVLERRGVHNRFQE